MQWNITQPWKGWDLIFAGPWVELEGVMLSETSQRKTNTVWYHFYVESKNYKELVHITEKKQTHKCREETSGY